MPFTNLIHILAQLGLLLSRGYNVPIPPKGNGIGTINSQKNKRHCKTCTSL